MKSILVAVDFSKAAENAALYAFHLGKELKSSLYLCNAYVIPAEVIGGHHIVWPLYDGSDLQKSNTKQLQALAKKLRDKDQISSPSSFFQSSISYGAFPGDVIDVIDDSSAETNAGLVVMGTSGTGKVSQLLLGSVARRAVDELSRPILLVPKEVSFISISKIAFATDLQPSHIKIIKALGKLAKAFDAELVIIYISRASYELQNYAELFEQFSDEVSKSTAYNKISFRNLPQADTDKGLAKLASDREINLLAIAHEHKGFFGRLFDPSHTKSLIDRLSVPLLVFPASSDDFYWSS